jgi:hypothetical protein
MYLFFCQVVCKISLNFNELLLVANPFNSIDCWLIKKPVFIDIVIYHKHLLIFRTDAFQEIIEYMIVSFPLGNWHYSTLLEQVTDDKGAFDVELSLTVKQKNQFAEPWWIIVSDSLCITKSL